MYLNFVLKGLFLGLAIAAPVGVISILCIKRTLLNGYLVGFCSGLGAATADGIYGLIGALGVNFIVNFFIEQEFFLRLIGGFFLIYLGIKTFFYSPNKILTVTSRSLISAYSSTLILTLTNPMTILSFASVFAGLRLININSNHLSVLCLVFGVFLGSSLWWLILSSAVNLLRTKINHKTLKLINRISGVIILIFACLALISN